LNPAANRFAFVVLFAGATAIGFAPLFVRLSEVGPSATAFYRVLFALPWLWLWLGLDRRRSGDTRQPANVKEFAQIAVAGLFFTADLSLWHWSLRYTTVANSTLLTNFAPIFVTIGARMLFGESITVRFLVGMTLALLGAGMLVGASLRLSADHLFGDLLSIVTATFYAGYLLSVSGLRRSFSGPTIMAWSGLVSCPAFALVAWLSDERMVPVSAAGWAAVLALAMISHVGGQSLIAYALGHLPASFSSVSLLWQPVIAALAAWLVLSEPLRPLQLLGGLAILSGIATARGSLNVRLRSRLKEPDFNN
jgi:drug/metabolite transporter (DMT)-like permease